MPLIYHFEKNDDTDDKIPYYLKRFLMKQILNNYSTLFEAIKGYSIGVLERGLTYSIAEWGE